ncbi:MAG: Maf family nucleotide pyrophosphatase [Acidimicrobiia bacterium]
MLASGSPARLRLLRDAGFDPDVVVSGVDEDGPDAPPSDIVAGLAARKAEVVAATLQGEAAVVVGCDSLLDVDGRAEGKPTSTEQARQRLLRLRGRSAILVTGHCIIDCRSGRRAAAVAATEVRFGSPSDAEIDAYLAGPEALQVAGAFTLDGRSAPFIDGIDGDPSNVIGLSLPLLRRLLGELGVGVTELWAPR